MDAEYVPPTQAPDLFQSLKLRRENVREQIADSIQDMVAANQLLPGAQLPSERDLAKSLGVNRATVRESIRLLEQRGLVRMKLGSGTFIANVSSSVVAESIARYFSFSSCSHDDLVTLREVLEPETAALAAERATAEDLALLKDRIDRLEEAFEKKGSVAYATADTAFHEALATATHNQLIIAISSGLHRIVHAWILAQSSIHPLEGGAMSHRPVYDAIMARDPEAARQAMRLHHTYTRSAMITDADLASLQAIEAQHPEPEA